MKGRRERVASEGCGAEVFAEAGASDRQLRETRGYYACPSCGDMYRRENGYRTSAMLSSYGIGVPFRLALFGWKWLVAGLELGWRFEWLLNATLLAMLPFGPALLASREWFGCTLIALWVAIPKTSSTSR